MIGIRGPVLYILDPSKIKEIPLLHYRFHSKGGKKAATGVYFEYYFGSVLLCSKEYRPSRTYLIKQRIHRPSLELPLPSNSDHMHR